jgi:ribosome-binding ATPase YchF (GTP1/OBG family)
MKIGFHDCNLAEGKTKYDDRRMNLLVEKCNPKKVSPYYVEFMRDEFTRSEAVVVSRGSILDLLVDDIEKCERQLENTGDAALKELFTRCISHLETESPLCDLATAEPEKETLRSMSVLSLKPVVVLDGEKTTTEIVELCLDKAGIVFFYTVGPKEVHAWPTEKGSDIVTCAGRIHTDLAKGFIKGDIASFDDFMSCHNWNDCVKKGLVKVVDRDYTIRPGDIIEIRFAL